MRIGLQGLGKLGLPVALAIESKGHEVCGYDIDERVHEIIRIRKLPYREKGAQELLDKTNIEIKDIPELVSFADIIFVPIQTPHHPKYEGITSLPTERMDFDYSFLKAGIRNLSEEIERQGKDKIVIIISTVLPGTIRREILPLLGPHTKLCYNPFFIAMGTTIDDFLNPEFVLFGVENEHAAKVTEKFYKTIHDRPFCKMSIESAEMTKIAYNTFITAKITIVNTIMEICHKTPGANVDDVTNALKMATDRIISTKYMSGGMGDSGACHPRDCIALSWLSRNLKLGYDIYESLMKSRENQTIWFYNLILNEFVKTKYPIVILGYTFKKNTNLTIGSHALLLESILREQPHSWLTNEPLYFSKYDPWVDKDIIEFKSPKIFFIGVNHDEFINFKFPKGSVVIDPWRFISEQEGVKLIKVGIGEKVSDVLV